MQLNQNKGITLISLVVTIIVLLVLAGVSINLLLGENGLITKTKSASANYSTMQTIEKIELVKAELAMEKDGIVRMDELIQKLIEKGIITENDVNVLEDDSVEIDIGGDTYILAEETNGEITAEYEGKTDNLTSQIKEVKIAELTTNKFKISVKTLHASGGTYEFYLKEGENEYGSTPNQTGKTNTYEYNGLEANKTYKVKVVVKIDGKEDIEKDDERLGSRTR